MTTTTTLDEFSGLLETFKQLVKAGVQANLSAWTDKEGNLKAKLDVKFCPAATPSSLPSKPPVSSPVAQAPGQPAAGRRRKRRGPAARERARARAACYRAAKAAAAAAQGGSSSASEGDKVSSAPEQTPTPPPPPPPPPPTSTARLVKVVERKAGSRLTFSQLDGEGGSEVDLDSEEERSPPPSKAVCYEECDIPFDHCEKCGKCEFLCVEHSGCDCDCTPDGFWNQDFEYYQYECAVCYCRTIHEEAHMML